MFKFGQKVYVKEIDSDNFIEGVYLESHKELEMHWVAVPGDVAYFRICISEEEYKRRNDTCLKVYGTIKRTPVYKGTDYVKQAEEISRLNGGLLSYETEPKPVEEYIDKKIGNINKRLGYLENKLGGDIKNELKRLSNTVYELQK